MTKPSNIYEMGLHESIWIDGFVILRVAGGWIYTSYDVNGELHNSMFVPYDNEFQQKPVDEEVELSDRDFGHVE
jgi:hypothetical protein